MGLTVITPADYGAVGNGTTNDTTAIQAFLNALRNGGVGCWDNKSYKVNEGTLVLQPTSSAGDTVGPTILGRGTLIASGAADAPILKIRNPDFSGNTAFYKNGSIGNLEFIDNASSGANRHGLSISGVQGWTGTIKGTNLHGSVIYVPLRNSPGGTDYYETFGNKLDITNLQGTHAYFNANNNVGGGNSCTVYASYSSGDGYVCSGGLGQEIRNISCSTASGWGFKFATTSNMATNFVADIGELDLCTTGGFLLEKIGDSTITRQRISVRRNGGVTYPTAACVRIGAAGAGDYVINTYINFRVRIISGVTPGNITPVLDCTNSGNIVNVVVDLTVQDETGTFPTGIPTLGPILVKNVRNDIRIKVNINGTPYINQM